MPWWPRPDHQLQPSRQRRRLSVINQPPPCAIGPPRTWRDDPAAIPTYINASRQRALALTEWRRWLAEYVVFAVASRRDDGMAWPITALHQLGEGRNAINAMSIRVNRYQRRAQMDAEVGPVAL